MEELLTKLMANEPVILCDAKKIKRALMDLDANTFFEIHGNNMEVYFLKNITKEGYECVRVNGLYDRSDVRYYIPFTFIPRTYAAMIQDVGFLLAAGIYIYIPSRVCVSQMGKQLKMGKSGDILRIGAPWLETSMLIQRALRETNNRWKAVIRTDGVINRISGILTKDAPNHDFHILRTLCEEPVENIMGMFTEQKVCIELTYRDKCVRVTDSVTGQAALKVESEGETIYTRGHKTKLTTEDQVSIIHLIHDTLFRLQKPLAG